MATYKYELHTHTHECDRCAHLSAAELVRLYKEAGYDGMVVTDHYIERFYRSWFPDEVAGLSHKEQVARWLRGYYAAKEEGEKIGFAVFPGAEVRFDEGPNDYLIYGLPMTSGSDIHGMNRLAKGGIETDRRITTPEELSAVLRRGEYRLIENYD